MIVVGITGATGAGKSTLLSVLCEGNALLIDCDELYHDLLNNKKEMIAELMECFPTAFAGEKLDRKKLGEAVFNNKEAQSRLTGCVYPYIIRAVEKKINWASERGYDVAAVDAYDLYGSGLNRICSFTVAVTAPEEMRIKRIIQRDKISYEYAKSRISSQKSDALYASECDYELANDCETKAEFEEKCKKFAERMLGEYYGKRKTVL